MEMTITGIIGCGFMGTAHLENLRRIPNVNIIAVADNSESKVSMLAEEFHIPHCYTDWQELINNPDIEVIHNCTPNCFHYEINEAAILAGKAIISEKPLTNSSRESAELVGLARKKRILTAVNYNYRNYPLMQHARQMIKSGALGEIYLVHGHYLQDWLLYQSDYNWRVDEEMGGASRAIADIGSHWCDLIQFLLGDQITRVFADLHTIHQKRLRPQTEVDTFKRKASKETTKGVEVTIKTEDTGSVIFQTNKGIRGVFNVSQVSAGHKNCFDFEINGSRMSVAWKQEEPNRLWLGYRDRPNEELVKDPALLNSESRAYAHYPGGHPEGYPDAFKNLFIHFYQAFKDGKNINDQVGFATFEDGYKENQIVEAVLQSHQKQRWIDLT